MTNYAKSTDFAIKDALLTGNANKLVKGSEVDVEFSNLELADVSNVKRTSTTGSALLPIGTTLQRDAAPAVGYTRVNTLTQTLEWWTGTIWASAISLSSFSSLSPSTFNVQNFSGTGAQTSFVLTAAPPDENNTQIYIAGAYQQKNTYSVSGSTITFSSAPPIGTDNIEVMTIAALDFGYLPASNLGGIADLTAATIPLAGTELVVLWDGADNRKVTAANFTAGSVTTNANLTGHITSVGNAAVLGSFTSAQLAAALTDETGSGANVFATSPTLVTPALGTPSALVGTNITGTAAGLTAGNVTTNANLTGHVTSVGNAAVLGSFTSAQLAAALTDETGSGANVFGTAPTLIGDVALSTGSVVQGTAAKGVNFTANTPAAGMASQLLNWYEDGTCTVSLTPSSSGSITMNASYVTMQYTRIGRQVTVLGQIVVTSVSAPVGALLLNGLPFACGTGPSFLGSVSVLANNFAAAAVSQITGIMNSNSTVVTFYKYSAGAVSNLAGDVQAGTEMYITVTYFV
jgi:hypothetical protein